MWRNGHFVFRNTFPKKLTLKGRVSGKFRSANSREDRVSGTLSVANSRFAVVPAIMLFGYGSKRDVDSFPNLALHAFVGCDKRGRATGEGRASWSWVITRER